MYNVEFTPKTDLQFSKLSADLQQRITNVLERIKINPYHHIKRKEGDYFLLRVGDYRAVLDIKNDKRAIFIIEIGHRKNIYKK